MKQREFSVQLEMPGDAVLFLPLEVGVDESAPEQWKIALTNVEPLLGYHLIRDAIQQPPEPFAGGSGSWRGGDQ